MSKKSKPGDGERGKGIRGIKPRFAGLYAQPRDEKPSNHKTDLPSKEKGETR